MVTVNGSTPKTVLIEKIEKILQEEDTRLPATSLAHVVEILLKNEGIHDVGLAEVMMGCGEVFVFSYSPYQLAPMYLGRIGFGKRLKSLFGVDMDYLDGPLWGTTHEESWEFVTKYLDKGHGVHMEGWEAFVIYGYQTGETIDDRMFICKAKWGPGLDGDVTWQEFVTSPEMPIFSIFSLFKTDEPQPTMTKVKKVIEDLHRYLTDHPAVGITFDVDPEIGIEEMKGGKVTFNESNFGLKAYENFLKDLKDPRMLKGMLQAYLHLHSINFQWWGKHWMGKWFENYAELVDTELKGLFIEISKQCMEISSKLKQFAEVNSRNYEKNEMHEKIEEAIPHIEDAYENEKKLVKIITKLAEMLGLTSFED